EERTRVGCMAECETRADCHAIDRPPTIGFAECCLFTGNNTGNGVADRFCFSKDVTRTPQAGDLIDTTVTVLPVPFLGYLTLSSHTVGVVATAEMGLCLPWTWCGFIVKDCSGAILYKIEVDTLPDIDGDGTVLPGTAGLSYVIKDAAGSYLGRSSHLTDGYEPIRLLDAENKQVSMLITAAGFWRRTFFPLRWFVNTAVTRQPASAVPLADPRLITMMVTFQFRNLGYFGIFWILLLVIVVVAVYFYLKRSRGLAYDGGFSIRGGWLKGLSYYSQADEEQEFLNGGDGGGCCTGRQKKTPQVTVSVARTLPQAGGGGRLTLERLDILPDGECDSRPLFLLTEHRQRAGLYKYDGAVEVQVRNIPSISAVLCLVFQLGAYVLCEPKSCQKAVHLGVGNDSTLGPHYMYLRFPGLNLEAFPGAGGKGPQISEQVSKHRRVSAVRANPAVVPGARLHREPPADPLLLQRTLRLHADRHARADLGTPVFDTEEDLEGLNKAIAWLYDRRIPVVLMERQTRIFPLIFDMDLKVTSQDMLDSVPVRIKRTRPWRGRVDFCRWHGADHFVLSKDMVLLRHLGMIVFQFFPDLPLIDFCIFNASGWDRVKELVKVSLHLVAPYVLVTPDRLTAIRERMLEYLGECSEADGHPLADLLQTYLQESEDNTWDKVVDQTVTSGTNGLRMPYCDKAQRILKREFVDRKRRGEVFTERQLMDLHAYLKEEAGRPCLPEGILRLIPAKNAEDENALPEAKWMCKGDDLPIDEWIRLGRCRYAWRMPLAPPGPTPWRPPLRYQWVEPVPLWEDRTQLKGSPVVRKFHGSAAEFRSNWEEALSRSPKLSGRWLISSIDARWRGGLENDSTHEVRYIVRASRVILLLSPEVGAALVFTELRKVLAGWTEPDDFLCVPICGSPSDSHSSALHTIVAPSKEFPTLQAALNAVPSDEPLHRVLVRCGTHELPETLCIKRPVLLEGEGRWETTLRSFSFIPELYCQSSTERVPRSRSASAPVRPASYSAPKSCLLHVFFMMPRHSGAQKYKLLVLHRSRYS
ncbi:unnamed protein product, partial [Symbiodinium necroappetens]